MRTTRILLAAATISLLMTGCAQKKVNTGLDGATTGVNGEYEMVEGYNDGTTTQAYDNVDPYGNGNYGTNGANGGYANNGINGNVNNASGKYGVGAGGVQNVYFDVDQYAITSEKLAIISNNANLLRDDLSQGEKLKIEGHCDATGTDEYNYALGLRRAKATKDTMVSRGINQDNISLVSMGESSPECTTSSSRECYSQNRRVEFKVIQ